MFVVCICVSWLLIVIIIIIFMFVTQPVWLIHEHSIFCYFSNKYIKHAIMTSCEATFDVVIVK